MKAKKVRQTLHDMKSGFCCLKFSGEKTLKRWIDVESKENYGTSDRIGRKIFHTKILKVLRYRDSWPTHASFDEDKNLRKPCWTEKYGDERFIEHDDTNIDFKFKPTATNAYHLTHSAYCGGNCVKGGVFFAALWLVRSVRIVDGRGE